MGRPNRTAIVVGVAAAALVTILAAAGAMLGVVGARAQPAAESTLTSGLPTGPTTAPAIGSATPPAGSSEDPDGHVISLHARAVDGPATDDPAVGDLVDGSVLRLDLAGFAAHTTGLIRQCVAEGGELGHCANALPVNFDVDGRAQVQYQVSYGFALAVSACTGSAAGCFVAVDGVDGHRAVVRTVFGGPVSPPVEVAANPTSALPAGDSAGARYDPGRAAGALAVCGVLLAVAVWLWRRTDWSTPSEAATPELDDARLE